MEELGGDGYYCEEGYCSTPKHGGCQIPAASECPPPPKKKRHSCTGRKREPPKNGYFQPPDLEFVFDMPTRSGAKPVPVPN